MMYPHFNWPRALRLTGQDGTTPLMLAACHGQDSIVTQLLEKQADTDTQNRVRAVDCTPSLCRWMLSQRCMWGRKDERGRINRIRNKSSISFGIHWLLADSPMVGWGGEGEGGCLFDCSLALCWLFFSSNFKNQFTWFEWEFHYFWMICWFLWLLLHYCRMVVQHSC